MRVGDGNLYRQSPLSRTQICERPIPLPGELLGDGPSRTTTERGHGLQEAGQTLRIGIDPGEEVLAFFELVLWFAGVQRCRQIAPERIEPCVGHLQQPAN